MRHIKLRWTSLHCIYSYICIYKSYYTALTWSALNGCVQSTDKVGCLRPMHDICHSFSMAKNLVSICFPHQNVQLFYQNELYSHTIWNLPTWQNIFSTDIVRDVRDKYQVWAQHHLTGQFLLFNDQSAPCFVGNFIKGKHTQKVKRWSFFSTLLPEWHRDTNVDRYSETYK